MITYNMENDEINVVAEDKKVDIGGVMYHPSEHRAQAYATDWTRKTWNILDDDIAADVNFLKTVADGDLDVVSRLADDEKWIVRYTLSDSPTAYYLYKRSAPGLKNFS